MSAPFQARPGMVLRQPCSLGLSALVAGAAVFLTDADVGLELLGYALVGLAILLLLHAGLSISRGDGGMAELPPHGGVPRSTAPETAQKSASRA